MQRRLVDLAVVVACALVVLLWLGPQDQSDTAVTPEPKVAVLDLGKVLRSHRPFVGRITKLQQEVKKLDAQLEVKKAELENLKKQVEAAAAGTPDRQDKQLLVVRLETEMKMFVTKNRQQVAAIEARVYDESYNEVMAEVQRYAKANSINLVLRVNDARANPTQQKSVKNRIDREVLYHEGLDISDAIIKALNPQPDV